MDTTDRIENVAIVLYPGFDELDAIGPYEVLENAAKHGIDIDVSLSTLDPTERVEASHGLVVEPDGVLGDSDLIVVPGGGWNDGAERGARAEVERGDLPEALAREHDDGTILASVCTGGMILAAAGALDGRPATTHHGAIDDLRAHDAGVEVIDARVVDDGDVLTAGGVTSGLDLALWLIEELGGEAMAERVATEMAYERRGEVYRG